MDAWDGAGPEVGVMRDRRVRALPTHLWLMDVRMFLSFAGGAATVSVLHHPAFWMACILAALPLVLRLLACLADFIQERIDLGGGPDEGGQS